MLENSWLTSWWAYSFKNAEAAITTETNHELFQESFEGWMGGDGVLKKRAAVVLERNWS